MRAPWRRTERGQHVIAGCGVVDWWYCWYRVGYTDEVEHCCYFLSFLFILPVAHEERSDVICFWLAAIKVMKRRDHRRFSVAFCAAVPPFCLVSGGTEWARPAIIHVAVLVIVGKRLDVSVLRQFSNQFSIYFFFFNFTAHAPRFKRKKKPFRVSRSVNLLSPLKVIELRVVHINWCSDFIYNYIERWNYRSISGDVLRYHKDMCSCFRLSLYYCWKNVRFFLTGYRWLAE